MIDNPLINAGMIIERLQNQLAVALDRCNELRQLGHDVCDMLEQRDQEIEQLKNELNTMKRSLKQVAWCHYDQETGITDCMQHWSDPFCKTPLYVIEDIPEEMV